MIEPTKTSIWLKNPYTRPVIAGTFNPSINRSERFMAHTIEVAILNPVEGKTRAQQIARLKEWKKHFLTMGAEKVVVKESGPGNIDGAWIFEIHHKSTAAYGAAIDSYYKSPKSHDEIMVKWQKTPTLSFTGYSLFIEVDEI